VHLHVLTRDKVECYNLCYQKCYHAYVVFLPINNRCVLNGHNGVCFVKVSWHLEHLLAVP